MEISLGREAGPCSASVRLLWEQDQTQPGFPALYSPLQCLFSKPISVISSPAVPLVLAHSMSPFLGVTPSSASPCIWCCHLLRGAVVREQGQHLSCATPGGSRSSTGATAGRGMGKVDGEGAWEKEGLVHEIFQVGKTGRVF